MYIGSRISPLSPPPRVLVLFLSTGFSRTRSRLSTTPTCKASSTMHLAMRCPRSTTPKNPWMPTSWTIPHPKKYSIPHCFHPHSKGLFVRMIVVRASLLGLAGTWCSPTSRDGHSTNTYALIPSPPCDMLHVYANSAPTVPCPNVCYTLCQVAFPFPCFSIPFV